MPSNGWVHVYPVSIKHAELVAHLELVRQARGFAVIGSLCIENEDLDFKVLYEGCF